MRELVAGDRVDQYELTELLARSGMASIFKAVDRKTGATVALKVPHLQYEADIAFYQRFEREEKIGQKLDHPNIVRVLSPEKKTRMYLVMELAEGNERVPDPVHDDGPASVGVGAHELLPRLVPQREGPVDRLKPLRQVRGRLVRQAAEGVDGDRVRQLVPALRPPFVPRRAARHLPSDEAAPRERCPFSLEA